MTPSSQDRTPDGQPPDTYTHGHHSSVLRSHTWRTIANSAAYLEPLLEPGRSLLDVGCGPGTITAELAERLAPAPVVGVDASAEVIERARTEAASGERDNLEFRVDDCYRLDIADRSFDLVHAHQVLQHLSDPVAALTEMRRVVAADGVVAVRDADYGGMFWAPAVPELDRWMEIYQTVARRNQAEPDAGRRLVEWARRAGFASITPSASTWCFATPADRTWWGDLWADRTTGSALARQAVAYGIADDDELRRLAAAWRSWADDPDGWFVVVHSEVLLRP